MKILSCMLLLYSCTCFAQTLHYQGIARNVQGEPLAQRQIAVRLAIKDAPNIGNTLYTETKSVTTNGFGMYSIAINDGEGTRTGSFTKIDWSQQRFIQTEIDPDNGTAFTDLGTAPLHSVPQALNALQAATLKGVPEPKEGYFVEFENGKWVQKPKPKKYMARGVGFNPTSSLNFVGPMCTITIEQDNPIITTTAVKAFGSSQDGGGLGLNIFLGYRRADQPESVAPTSFMGSVGIHGHRVPKGTRISIPITGSFQTDFKVGEQYVIGMLCYSVSQSGSWNDNGDGTMVVEVSY